MSSLRPVTTLADVFGPRVAYVPRRSPNLPGWSPPLPGQVDFLTGLQVGLAGGMAYVVCAATVTPPAVALRSEAGLPVDAELHTYRSVAEYLPLLTRLMDKGYVLANQRAHPEAEIPPHGAHTSPSLIAELNDKGNLDALVPAALVPFRRTLPVADLPEASALLADGRPIVLKAATHKPSGGGHGVWICRTPSEVAAARGLLAGDERVVVEEFLHIDTTVCVHGVVYPDGRSVLIGSAEEIVREGRWLGNWYDAQGDAVPAKIRAVVLGIMTDAAARGYRGITGVDVARLRDGTWRILDLNFRVNGSTSGVWLREPIRKERGAAVMLGRGWSCKGGFERLCGVVRSAVRRGSLLPLGFYDPDAGDMGGLARVSGLLLGESREALEEESQRLIREGLS
ncbi:MAG TPA: hypothetical protein VJU15_13670 [Gemmatimonadales bacterium]|nr:hypothetical protein [Gemmatimonadales bacterium]